MTLGVYADGKLLKKLLANHSRPDLPAAGLGSGVHGFAASLPRGTPAGITIMRIADGSPSP